jgi:very-short-patch-repair endonuclease
MARPYRGVYLVGSAAIDLLDRAHAALAVAPDAVLGYHTAAALHGFGCLESDAVHVVIPAGARFPQRRGIVVHQSIVAVEAAMVLGVPCTTAARTAIDLARRLHRSDALAVLDAAIASGACDPDALATEGLRHERLRGSKRAKELIPLADGRAECAQESRLRLILYDGGLTTFEPQVPVFDGSPWPRYVLDLADRERLVGAEYDGSSHLDRGRLRSDRRRHNWLDAAGWTMRYFTDHDIYRTPDDVVQTVKAALRQAAHHRR